MATKKKSSTKPAKKAKKAKTVAKSRKPVSAKKVVAKKSKPASTAKKAKARKVAPKAAPKVTPKAAASKATGQKTVAPKAAPKKVAPKVDKKVALKKAAPGSRKSIQPAQEAPTPQASSAAKIAAAAQLNFFQMPNQRPMAHKPAKPSSTSQDKTRYSEEELPGIPGIDKQKSWRKRVRNIRSLKETLNRNNDEGTDATSGGNTKVLEDGAETAEKENLSQLAARQQKYITNLENALVRIKNGTYGICSVTGKLISKERLIAVPHTTQSIEAKLMQQD